MVGGRGEVPRVVHMWMYGARALPTVFERDSNRQFKSLTPQLLAGLLRLLGSQGFDIQSNRPDTGQGYQIDVETDERCVSLVVVHPGQIAGLRVIRGNGLD